MNFIKWPWHREIKPSTIKINNLGCLLMIKFTSIASGKSSANEIKVMRVMKDWIFSAKKDKRIYEIKMTGSTILIYCNSAKDCDSIKLIFEEIDKKNFN
jgi:hypothetical protein